jgi:hypothetical protein
MRIPINLINLLGGNMDEDDKLKYRTEKAEAYIESLRAADRGQLEYLLRCHYISQSSRKRDRREIKKLLERALLILE